jgi:exosortase
VSLGSVLALLLGLYAYRALVFDALWLPSSSGFERWFFTPERKGALLPIAIAVWMLVRRRSRLVALPDRGAPLIAGALLAAGVGLFAWAHLARASSLLLPSLAANLLALGAAAKGPSGCRAVLLPALVLLLGVPLPAPLRVELVWWLQVSSTHGAAWLLEHAGFDIVLRGVQIHRENYAFAVVETCSGLRGIEVLTIVALAIRELFASSGARSWIVVSIAPLLAFALNVLRIAVVVASTGSAGSEVRLEETWDHTPQGMAVLLLGTALLYALAHRLAASARVADPVEGQHTSEQASSGRTPRGAARIGAPVALAALAILSVALAPLPRLPEPPAIELPRELAGWKGDDLPLDRVFIGQFLPGQVLHRRYRLELPGQPPQSVVDLLVGYEDPENAASRLLSPKLLVPDYDWSLVDSGPARLWLLGLDARSAVAARDSEFLLGYLWRLRDEGLWRETWRAALALDVGPLRRDAPRAVMRLTTPIAHAGPAERDRAKRVLDRFINDFRAELEQL